MVSRLEPKEEKPEERTEFRHRDLLEWLSQNRPAAVAAALTMVRA